MSSFSKLEPVIAKWAGTVGSTPVTEWSGRPARVFYTPGDPPFEVFQITIGLPEAGLTAVSARAVDTNDDTDEVMDKTWEGPVGELDDMLRAAMATIENWKARNRK